MEILKFIKAHWKIQKENTIYFIIFLAFLFVLPLYKISSSPFLILFALISVFKIFQSKGKLFQSVFLSKISVFFNLFFAVYALSLFYSVNKTQGFDQINKLLPYVLFPIVFCFYHPSRKEVIFLLKGFILGCLMAFVLSLGSQFYLFLQGEVYSFYYLDFIDILWMHPTYLSLYLNFSILAVYYLYTQKEVSFFYVGFIIIVFIFFILLLLARMQIIIMFLCLLLIGGHLVIKNWSFKKGLVILLFSFGALFFISQNEKLTNRFTYVQNLDYDYTQSKNWNGANVRLAIWNSAFDVIKENIFIGVGVGDVDDELMNSYQKNNFQFAYDLNYVAHNQYVQILLATGVLGLIIYLTIFFLVVYEAIKTKNFLFFSLMFVLFMTGFTESFLRMQSGLVFFVLMIFLTLHLESQKAEKNALNL